MPHLSPRDARLTDRAASESYLVLLVCAAATLLLLGLGFLMSADSWLALTAGRVVAESGPPSVDTLTTWTLGREWVDQQWLGQLVLYGLWEVGGLLLVGFVHVLLVIGVFVGVLTVARRRGALPRDVALIGLLALLPIGLVAANIRTQSLALPIFAAVLWLVSEDSRAPSRRVFWCLPLLMVWANIHGSVMVGAGLVGLAGTLSIVHGLRSGGTTSEIGRGMLLLAGVVLALMATPYGTALVSYLRDLFTNSEIGEIAPEWMPTALAPVHVPFFLLAALSLALLGRDRRQLTAFEQITLVILLGGALLAERNLAWFGLAAVMLLPPVLTRHRRAPTGRPPSTRFAAAMSAVGVGVAALAGAQALARAERQLDSRFPAGALAAVARAADADPNMLLFVHPRYADWLLFGHPALRGRIPLDIRYELLTPAELRRFRRVRDQIGVDWRSAIARARLVMLDSSEKPLDTLPPTTAVLLREPGARLLYDGDDIAVILRAVPG